MPMEKINIKKSSRLLHRTRPTKKWL